MLTNKKQFYFADFLKHIISIFSFEKLFFRPFSFSLLFSVFVILKQYNDTNQWRSWKVSRKDVETRWNTLEHVSVFFCNNYVFCVRLISIISVIISERLTDVTTFFSKMSFSESVLAHHEGSISSTFDEQLFWAAFLYLQFEFVIFVGKRTLAKKLLINIW